MADTQLALAPAGEGGGGTDADAVDHAMAKIASHINTAKKFSKASKLALQLLESGSVNSENAGRFFEILERAKESPQISNEPALREDYRSLFSATEERKDLFSERQRGRLEVWCLRAGLANELHTDDTFQFSRAVAKVKTLLEALPPYTEADELVAALPPSTDPFESGAAPAETSGAPLEPPGAGPPDSEAREALDNPGSERPGKRQRKTKVEDNPDDDPFGLGEMLPGSTPEESDPFGLADLVPKGKGRKEERAKRKRDEEERAAREEVEAKQLLLGRRDAALECLKAAEAQYKYTWAKPSVEILMKLAFDHISRFTPPQQKEVEALWTTIRNEQIRRKQGKAGTHKLGKQEVTSYERVASKWAGEKMSIRSSVGATGDGSTVTWLG